MLYLSKFLGAFISVFAYILAFYAAWKWYKFRRRIDAPAWVWRQYYKELVKREDYEEAAKVMAILKEKSKYDKINTPKGYVVEKGSKLDLEDSFSDHMTVRLNNEYIVTRKFKDQENETYTFKE